MKALRLKALAVGMALAFSVAAAQAQQAAQQPARDVSPIVVAGAVFVGSFYFYLQCMTGDCAPVPCWMTATCKKAS